jgi:hypothetical protein
VANLPDGSSNHRVEKITIGGGDACAVPWLTERLVSRVRERFPQGPEKLSVDERRAGGWMVVALQTSGTLFADPEGMIWTGLIERWLRLGVDSFEVPSQDIYHRMTLPDYSWLRLFKGLTDYSELFRVPVHISGTDMSSLIRSGRAWENWERLKSLGCSPATEGNCRNGWGTAGGFLGGVNSSRHSSLVTVDPDGGVHPCVWYRMSPAMFNLGEAPFETGMDAAMREDSYRLLNEGDIRSLCARAGMDQSDYERLVDGSGECSACREAFRVSKPPANALLCART